MAAKEFLDLIKEGKIDEARKMLEDEKAKAEFAPDAFTKNEDSSVPFTHRGKRVEQDAQGNWHLKK